MASRGRQIYESWAEIQDIIGKASLWPVRIRRLFWTKNIKNFERFIVCVFVYVNGLNPELFKEWALLMGLLRDNEAHRHVDYLFTKFEEGKYAKEHYAYNVSQQRYEYIDGTRRTYIHKTDRK